LDRRLSWTLSSKKRSLKLHLLPLLKRRIITGRLELTKRTSTRRGLSQLNKKRSLIPRERISRDLPGGCLTQHSPPTLASLLFIRMAWRISTLLMAEIFTVNICSLIISILRAVTICLSINRLIKMQWSTG
jgi:hypothetical protein